jgi:FMN phosphatase YigB (HAD superfamily)
MRSGSVSSARRIVVLDLDGTVAVGDEPVLAYFRGVAGGEADDVLARWVLTGGEGYRDGYALVADWAAAHEVVDEVRSAAYAASRQALHDGTATVTAPEGLAELLRRRPDDVRCVLVTNAPVDGIEPLLARLGLEGLLDDVIGEAGKPVGMPAVLDRLLGELPADRLLSVGDVWANDLAPAAAIGATTAFIDRFGPGRGDPTFRASTLEQLLPDIEHWWSA